jgi:hypothetical protein
VRIADVSNTLFGPSFSSELVTVSNDVNNRLVKNSGVSHRTLLPNVPPNPITSVNWYQAWDPSGKGSSFRSLETTSDGAYIE